MSVGLAYLEGGNTSMLQPCDSDIPGCFDVTASGSIAPGEVEYGSLNINFPGGLPPSFAGDFFITLTRTDTGDTLSENWIKIRPLIYCDVNQDGVVNSVDINSIFFLIGAEVQAGNRYKQDGSAGVITVNDARTCVTRCAKPDCAQ